MPFKKPVIKVVLLVILAFLGAVIFAVSQYTYHLVSSQIPQMKEEKTMVLAAPPLFYSEIGKSHLHERSAKSIKLPSYTVEIDSFASETLAQKKVRELSQKGIDCFYTPFNQQGIVVFRVRSGMYANLALAKKQRQFLAKELKISGQVTKL